MTDIATFADHIALGELKARYCRCLDTKDWAGYAACFTEDLVMDTRPSGGTLVEGRAAALAMVRAALETAKTAHQVHAPEIRLEGDTAHGIWAMQDRVVWSAERAAAVGHAGLTGYGHYHERYVREGGRWLIAETRLTRLHMDVDPLPA